MKFKKLRIGDVFTINTGMIYKKVSPVEAEYGVNGYYRVFSDNDEVNLYSNEFTALFKTEAWIPEHLKNKRKVLKRIPCYFSALGERIEKPLYLDVKGNLVISADSFYVIQEIEKEN